MQRRRSARMDASITHHHHDSCRQAMRMRMHMAVSSWRWRRMRAEPQPLHFDCPSLFRMRWRDPSLPPSSLLLWASIAWCSILLDAYSFSSVEPNLQRRLAAGWAEVRVCVRAAPFDSAPIRAHAHAVLRRSMEGHHACRFITCPSFTGTSRGVNYSSRLTPQPRPYRRRSPVRLARP